MARVGRRTGFVGGSLLVVAGGLVSALGIATASLPTLAAGTFLVGNQEAFALHYRFAVCEVVEAERRPRAIALVMGGGVAAAFLGPLLASYGASLLHPEYLGSFLILAVVTLAGTACLLGLDIPPNVTHAHGTPARQGPRKTILKPAYLVALFGAATAYGAMTLAMTASPLAMAHHHFDLRASASAIQLHTLSMFLPSFITGSLVARFGALRIMLMVTAIFAIHVVMTMTGTGLGSFLGALMFLGVGWNFLYIGSTALLTSSYKAEDGARAQAFNDTTIFLVSLACSLSAGGLLHALGWERLNLSLLPWLVVAASTMVMLELKNRRGLVGQIRGTGGHLRSRTCLSVPGRVENEAFVTARTE